MIDRDILPECENKKIAHDRLMARPDIKAQVYKAIVEKPITMAEIKLLPANPKHHTYYTSFRQWAEAGLVAKDSKGRMYCLIPGTPSNQAVIEQGTYSLSRKIYIPTKADCEKAIESLRKTSSSNPINDEQVLSYLEEEFKNKTIILHEHWRSITRGNFKNWFK